MPCPECGRDVSPSRKHTRPDNFRPCDVRELAACRAWDAEHPVGTLVRYWTGVRRHEGARADEPPTGEGIVKSAATVVCHSPVAWITGAGSCIALTHVQKVNSAARAPACSECGREVSPGRPHKRPDNGKPCDFRLQAEARAWNAEHPLGTRVRYWTGVRRWPGTTVDAPPTGEGAVRHGATVMSGHLSAWIEGVPGSISITHIQKAS